MRSHPPPPPDTLFYPPHAVASGRIHPPQVPFHRAPPRFPAFHHLRCSRRLCGRIRSHPVASIIPLASGIIFVGFAPRAVACGRMRPHLPALPRIPRILRAHSPVRLPVILHIPPRKHPDDPRLPLQRLRLLPLIHRPHRQHHPPEIPVAQPLQRLPYHIRHHQIHIRDPFTPHPRSRRRPAAPAPGSHAGAPPQASPAHSSPAHSGASHRPSAAPSSPSASPA